jgi:hypothetical protein
MQFDFSSCDKTLMKQNKRIMKIHFEHTSSYGYLDNLSTWWCVPFFGPVHPSQDVVQRSSGSFFWASRSIYFNQVPSWSSYAYQFTVLICGIIFLIDLPSARPSKSMYNLHRNCNTISSCIYLNGTSFIYCNFSKYPSGSSNLILAFCKVHHTVTWTK